MSAVARKIRVRAEPETPAPRRKARSHPAPEWRAEPTPATAGRPSLERLRSAAAIAPEPLPRRPELEALFGADLSGIETVSGAEAEAALDAARAEAATVEGRLVLRAHAPLPVLAHEVTHALQSRPGEAVALTARGDAAECEAETAERLARAAEEAGAVAETASGDRPAIAAEAALAPGEAALRRRDQAIPEVPRSQPEAAEAFDRGAAAEEAAPAQGGGETAAAPAEPTPARAAEGEPGARRPPGEPVPAGGDLGADIAEELTPTFEAPPIPEIEVDGEAAEAKKEAAREKLAGAEDADALMDAFRDAPPSVKAEKHDSLEGETARLAREEQAAFDADMPDFDAKMSGEDDLPAAEPVLTPSAKAAALAEGLEGPTPEPEIDPTPEPAKADVNRRVREFLRRFFSFGSAKSLGRTFGKVTTADREVDTSAGERPTVPLEGTTDPQQVEDRGRAAIEDAAAKRRDATRAVLEGPGPERVQLKAMKEEHRLPARAAPEIAETKGGAEGATAFREKPLEPEVVALFDQAHAEGMSASLAEAQGEMKAAVGGRDRERDAEVSEAEAERDRLNREADEEQRSAVMTGRDAIQTARQQAVDDQEARRKDFEDQAETDRKTVEGEIDTKMREAETEADRKYDKAEGDAEAKVEEGEKKAEAEKARQERESRNKSWWERATDWVAEQFDKLTAFINDVFDAVRKAVKEIIDKVKKAVVAVIDAAAAAIKSAIKGFGALLKKGVDALLGEHFPGIAAKLNNAIDTGVDVAVKAVDAAADTLKKGITALLDALGKALDAILAAFQAAVNAALALAKAAITGDWAAVAKMIVEPILNALGIDPQEFYRLIAKAMDALGDIVDDPGGFVSNLIDAVVLGFRKFAGNIVMHLKKGVIGWLTGALGGAITIPEKFDLMGVLELGRQILGLTAAMIRKVAVRILGETAVERIEFFMGYVTELITGGWNALWSKITEDLGNLRDMIFGQIKEFVLTRIVMAGITWLASLFSPVGALVKLVMTIWNFLMFLKDQLMRIIEVAKTVIGFMYDIAKGVIAGAATGVEKVLGNLVPIVLDLIARLLGLGNVAGRVRRIIARVQQRIEDAIVKLIRKVLARFVPKGRGAKGKTGEAGAGAETDSGALMAPITVSAAGQTHTLFVKREGREAVPMMRSEETPVETWLKSLTTVDGLMAAYNANRSAETRITREQAAEKLDDVAGLVRKALGLEAGLETRSESEIAEEAAGRDIEANDAEVAEAGRRLKAGLETVLQALGLSQTAGLWAILEGDINAHVNPALHPALKNVLGRFPEDRVAALSDWSDFVAAFLEDPPGIWTAPLAAGGVLRRSPLSGGVLGAMRAAALAEAKAQGKEKARGKLTTLTDEDFASHYLVTALRETAAAQADLRARLLSTRDPERYVDRAAQRPALAAIIARIEGEQASRRMDIDVFDKVKPGSVLRQMEAAARGGGRVFMHWPEQGPDGERVGPKRGPYHLGQMLDESITAKWKANRGHVSDAIRGIHPGNHEWIPGQMAKRVIEATAKLDRPVDAGAGLSRLIRFQNEVRTPTSKLIFRPKAALQHIEREFGYVSHAHMRSGTPYKELSPEQHAEFYPDTGPEFGEPVPILQAHAGGLDALEMDEEVKRRPLSAPSDDWHRQLIDRIAAPLRDSLVEVEEARALKAEILGHYRSTIWRGKQRLPAVQKAHFDAYYTSSDGQTRSYGELKAYAGRAYHRTLSELTKDIDEVLS